MATFTDTIRFVVEATTGQARSQLNGLRTELAAAEGAGGKMRAGIAGIGGALRDNLALGLTGAATAVAGFAANAVQQFQDTAREAGRLADTTGLATDEASRFLAVLRPLGVEGADLADILGNINTKAAEGRLGELGIQAEDSNERLIQTIEYLGSITDETKRAQIAAELLGEEGTRQLAPLVARASELRDRLGEVSDAQVITDEEREKAREFDKAMGDLKRTLDEITITLGGSLVPLLSDVAGGVKLVGDVINMLPDLPDWAEWVLRNNPAYWLNRGREYFQQSLETGLFPRGLESTAGMAPAGTPGTNPVPSRIGAPTIGTQIINPPPGYRGEDITAAQGNFWQTNGTSTWRGQP